MSSEKNKYRENEDAGLVEASGQPALYQISGKDALTRLESRESGLSSAEVQERQEKYGYNELAETGKKSVLRIFAEQWKDFLVMILIAAAIISAVLGDWESMLVILIVLAMNAVLGTVQQVKADQSLESLKQLSAPSAKVVRDGKNLVLLCWKQETISAQTDVLLKMPE